MKTIDNKHVWIIIVAIVVVAYAIINQKYQSSPSLLPVISSSPVASSTPVAKKGSSVKQSAVTSPKSYSNYVKEYEGRRVQFDQNCQMFPNSITYKNGTNIMLDNRTSTAKTITVGGKSYSLVAYGYQIINLSSSKVPSELIFNCGSAVNVGRILLQAMIL